MTRHTFVQTLPQGPVDLSAEVEVRITFDYRAAHPPIWDGRAYKSPAEDALVEFVKAEPFCNGKPSPFYGAFADLEQDGLDDLVTRWLENDGRQVAIDFAEEHAEPDTDLKERLAAEAKP